MGIAGYGVILSSAAIVAAAVAWAASRVAGELRAARTGSGSSERVTTLLAVFAPAVAAAQQDPRAILVWQPMAQAARNLYPDEFAALDRAAGAAFPFSKERIEAAHAQWTTDWLAWEHAHDIEYKL